MVVLFECDACCSVVVHFDICAVQNVVDYVVLKCFHYGDLCGVILI